MTFRLAIKQMLLFPLQPRRVEKVMQLLRTLRMLPWRVQGRWPPERIIVVNPTHTVGDAFIMMPLLDALHRALPEAAIDLVAEGPMVGPLRSIAYLREVLSFSPVGYKYPIIINYLRVYSMFRFARRELMNREYDLALLPRWGTDPYLLTYLAAMTTAPQRAGHHPEDEVSPLYPFLGMERLLTIVSRGGAGVAEGVREQLVLEACGLVKPIDPAREELRPVESVLQMGRSVDGKACSRRLGISTEGSYILLAPGASLAVKCWPAERFAALGKALHRRTGAQVWTIAGASDSAVASEIEVLSGGVVRSLAGKTTLPETVALVSRASLLIANDSGPAHIGGSCGVPTLVLSLCPKTSTWEHPCSPNRIRPVGPNVTVMQPDEPAEGCGEQCVKRMPHCIRGLLTEEVTRKALFLFDAYVANSNNISAGASG